MKAAKKCKPEWRTYQLSATHSEHFEIDGTHDVAVANLRDDSDSQMESAIHRWSRTNFMELRRIATLGAIVREHFMFDWTHNAAMANLRDDSTSQMAIFVSAPVFTGPALSRAEG